MPIVIKKDDYELCRKNDVCYAYNSLFMGNVKHLVLQAAFEAIYPDPKSFHIPIIAKFIPDSNNETVIVDNHLKISNAHDIEYLMPREHLKVWRLSYLLMNIILIFITAILITIMTLFYFFKARYNIILVIATIILAIYFVILIIKLIRQIKVSTSKKVRLISIKELEEVLK